MKIALFAETYLPYINGVVTHIKVLKDGLTEKGHEVIIVTADPGAKRHYIRDGVLHCPARAFKRLYGYGFSSLNSRVRMKAIQDFNPDVLHMHQEFSMGYFATLVARKLKKPLVYTLHTMYDEYLFYIAPKPLIPAVRGISHSYARLLAKKAAALTSPSEKAIEFFERCHVGKSVEIIPNSIDFEAFDPEKVDPALLAKTREKLGLKDGCTAALFVGRLGKEKSVDLLLEYWAQFFKGDDKMRLVIVGGGPEHEPLVELATKLGIRDQVSFAGRIDHGEIVPYFVACDFYVSASLTEMMSVSMLESMAAGLPAIQRYDEKNASQVKDGVNGYMFKTPEEMAECVRALAALSDEEKKILHKRVRESMCDAGARNLADRMLSVYSRVTGIPVGN